MAHEITFDDAGNIRMIYTDELIGLLDEGEATVVRASHVEPAPGGGWTADLAPSGGPILGPFKRHDEAIEAELKWLRENM